MKVLSLFDGMSCGQIALDQLGIPVDTYYASEIDKYAIQVTQANYPNTVQVGNVTNLDPKDFADVDLIMGGSPCQGFSFAGKQLAFDDPRSALFFEFIRLLKDIKPKYFLLENVRMKKEFLDIISQEVSKCYPEIAFGIEPVLINSALVSAQSRQRYYWTNMPNIKQPEDRGIVQRDILETDVNDELSEEAKDYMKRSSDKWSGGKTRKDIYIKHESEKGMCLTANMHKGVPYGVIAVDKNGHDTSKDPTWRKLTPLECERLQTVPDNYTNYVSDTQRYKMLGNGWTVEVIKHILQSIKA